MAVITTIMQWIFIPLPYQTAEYIENIKYAANETAIQYEVHDIDLGGSIPNVKNGHYIIGKKYDIDSTVYPIIVGVIIEKFRNMSFEIRIDCYNNDIQTGYSIIKSFESYYLNTIGTINPNQSSSSPAQKNSQ